MNKELSTNFNDNDIRIFDFDESVKKAWITKKKNIITQNARFENIVYQHDYIKHDSDWYNGFKQHGNNWKACMTKMVNTNGDRYRDWIMIPDHSCQKLIRYAGLIREEMMLPYNENRFNRFQYFSGAYWVAKKSIMREIPLNEKLAWGQGEDVEWSEKYRRKYKFSMNIKSRVHLLKHHHPVWRLPPPEKMKKMIEFIGKFPR